MGYVEVIKVSPTDLDRCDQCNQQGLRTSGQYVMHNGEAIMWICFNCAYKQSNRND